MKYEDAPHAVKTKLLHKLVHEQKVGDWQIDEIITLLMSDALLDEVRLTKTGGSPSAMKVWVVTDGRWYEY